MERPRSQSRASTTSPLSRRALLPASVEPRLLLRSNGGEVRSVFSVAATAARFLEGDSSLALLGWLRLLPAPPEEDLRSSRVGVEAEEEGRPSPEKDGVSSGAPEVPLWLVAGCGMFVASDKGPICGKGASVSHWSFCMISWCRELALHTGKQCGQARAGFSERGQVGRVTTVI